MRSNPLQPLHRFAGTPPIGALSLILIGSADPTLTHRLSGVLHSLYVMAAVLAVLLVISLLVAVWAFRRSRDTEPRA